jgi:hypothetical protein
MEPDAETDAVELAAAELIAQVKKTQSDEAELPIVDEASVWTVKVKKLGIRPEPDKPKNVA